MSRRKELILNYIKSDHGMNYNDKYYRYKNVNNYFFNDEEGNKYRWSTKNDIGFFTNVKYKFQCTEEDEKGQEGEIIIKRPKIFAYTKNSYGQYNWLEVNQHKYDNYH